MSQNLRYEFRLFGPRKGQTVMINGHQFVSGISHKVIAADKAGFVLQGLSFYGAYAKGTPEYDQALAKENAENGTGEVDSGSERGTPEQVSSDVQSDGGGSTKTTSDERSGTDAASPTSSGNSATGDGSEHAGVPKFEEAASLPKPHEPHSVVSDEVKSALLKLDPNVDDHWVRTGAHAGKPKLSAVEDAYGRAGLTRTDLEAAIPGWTRDRALEAALEE